ncbi:hypothetical protein ZIOFF_062982 [Zingiber officinale]|uniref:Pectinesterase catalytic domain-containing protein n=1 Tax=Zingiber officinale TaxID=94328 RepID=A0A8J5KB10_ZINOF|nr:hypothetical protein ZIOFF_062982 [Zingiber officinale]
MSSFLSLIKIDGGPGSRRLLTKDQRLIREEAFPNWHHDGDVRQFLLGCAAKQLIPNVMVAKDDIGDFKIFSEVCGKISSSYEDRYVIYVKEGVYEEQVVVDLISVSIYSDNSRKSVIIRSKNFIDDTTLSETTTFGNRPIEIRVRFFG